MRSTWTSFLAFHQWADYNSRMPANRCSTTSSSSAAAPRASPPRSALKQLVRRKRSVCVLEKGSEIGAHILSGAVMDPRALDGADSRLEGQGRAAQHAGDRRPLPVPHRNIVLPHARLRCCPRASRTTATTSSASATSRAGWASRPRSSASRSFPASPPPKSCTKATAVKGVATGDMGIGKKGEKTDAYQPGMELHGKYTFFAEGCRGQLGRQLEERFKLAKTDPQVYGIGLKELWEVKPEKPPAGAGDAHRGLAARLRHLRRLVPLPHGEQPGRGRLRRRPRLRESLPLAVRGVPALQDPSGDPRRSSRAASASAYGARAIAAGGLQSLPKLVFPGGALIGDDAGFLNASRIKGSHAAIKSGMLAAEAAFDALKAGRAQRRARRLSGGVPRELAPRRAASRAQLQAVDVEGPVPRHADGRHRPGAVPRQGAVDPAPRARRPRNARAGKRRHADRVSEARRRADVRPAHRRCSSRTPTTTRTSRRT